MLLQRIPSLLLAASIASTAHAVKDSSPFFLLSTENSQTLSLLSSQIASASRLEEQLSDSLGSCDSQLYVVVPQSGLAASHIRQMELTKTVATRYSTVVDIPEVLGDMDMADVASRLRSRCGLEPATVEEYFSDDTPISLRKQTIIVTSTPEPETNHRITAKEAESTLTRLFSLLANHSSHTLIVASSPATTAESEDYDMDADSEALNQNVMHKDLKRDVHSPLLRRQSNRTSPSDPQAGLPLFERYQFLTPGIFMGLSVSLLLFVILYVGVSAIAGLEVSYAAFSKENGPQGQGKKQQ